MPSATRPLLFPTWIPSGKALIRRLSLEPSRTVNLVQMSKYIFSTIFLILVCASFAQEANETIERDFRPHEIKIGVNGIRSFRTPLNSDYTSHELQTMVGFYRYILVIDAGTEKNLRGETFNYENSGWYWRSGVDWNFIKNKESGNVLSLGLRYARASFKDELEYTSDQGFGEEDFRYSNTDLTARWYELTLNMRGKVATNLYMGFTLRWQFSRKINGEGDLKTFDIPGFGSTTRNNSTAFDYYLAWRLPFRKD